MDQKFERFRILGSKRAISTTLASLLLIVIAVAAIMVTYAWINTNGGNTSTQEVVLQKAKVSFDTGVITLDIGNGGTANSEIIQVYIGTSSATIQNQTTNPAMPLSLKAGADTSFGVSYSWSSGQVYYFKIVAASGTPLEFSEQAPQ